MLILRVVQRKKGIAKIGASLSRRFTFGETSEIKSLFHLGDDPGTPEHQEGSPQ
jgi:hypothetical protein